MCAARSCSWSEPMSRLERFMITVGLNAYTSPHMIRVCVELLAREDEPEAPREALPVEFDEREVERAFARIVRRYGATS